MADLSVVVTGQGLGRSQLMGGLAPLTVAVVVESVRVVPQAVAHGWTPLLALLASEGIKAIADTVTRTWHDTGDVAFNASPDHATVISYTARLRLSGSETIIATEPLGKPAPDGNGVIVISLAGFLAYRAAGTYTISILATDAGGSTDSAVSNAFTLPLPWPTERLRIAENVTAVRV